MPDLTIRPQLTDALKNLPDKAGVYLFKDARGRLLYVGKADSLRDRVRSYFHDQALLTPKIQRVVEQPEQREFILSDSPDQDLSGENDLGRREQPHYTSEERDVRQSPYIRHNSEAG